MAKKKSVTKSSIKNQKRGRRVSVEVDKVAMTAAALGTFLIASEVSAAEDDRQLSTQAQQDQNLLQAQLDQTLQLDPAALAVPELPSDLAQLLGGDLPADALPSDLPQVFQDVPVADLDGMTLSQAAPDTATAPGVDAKTTMSDAGGGSAGNASAGAASGAADAGAAAGSAAGGAAAGGMSGLAAFSALPAGVIAGALGAVGVVAAVAGGGGGGAAAGGGVAGGVTSLAKGLVVDGNVKGATIFYDANANGKLDDGEKFTVTDDNGGYTLTGYTETANGHFVVLAGGVDILTGQKVGMMVTPHGYTSVSPLTTLLAATPGMTEADLKAKLGIDASIDLNNYDPLADMKSSDPVKAAAAQKAFTVSQQVYAVLQTAAELKGATSDGSVDAADITSIAQTLANSIMNSTGSDSVSILQQAAQQTVSVAANGNTDLANAVSAALSNVTSAIETSYANLATTLQSNNAASIANAVSVAAVSQSALVSAVTKGAAGDTSTLNLLSDSSSLSKLADLYESGIKSNIETGGTTTVTVTVPSTFTVAQALAASPLPTNYTIVDTAANIMTELGAHGGSSALLTGAIGVVAKSAVAWNLLEVENLIEAFPSISLEQKDIAPGAGTEDLTLANAKALADKFLKFPAGDVITVSFVKSDLGSVVDYALKFGNLGIDVLNPSAAVTLTAAQATALVTTGHMVFAGPADVTLQLSPTELNTALATLSGAQALHAAGIDHLAAPSGSLSLTLSQAQNLVDAELDLSAIQHGTLLTSTTSGISDSLLHSFSQAHFDTISAPTTAPALSTTDHFATQMITEGLHFADASNVTLGLTADNAGHTHLSTSLKQLQQLGVDQVGIAGGTGNVVVDLGTGAWGTSGLPSFDLDDNVHLQFTDAQLQEVIDHKAALLGSHIDDLTANDLTVTLDVTQADALLGSDGAFNAGTDLGFHTANDVTLTVANNTGAIGHIASEAAALKTLGVDQIDVAGSHVNVNVTDLQAGALVHGGLAFSTDDNINVEVAAGTHMKTTLQELQKLGVDSVGLIGGAHGEITVDLGDNSQINYGGLPSFNTLDNVHLQFTDAQLQDVIDHKGVLAGHNIDDLISSDLTTTLTVTQADALLGNDGVFNAGADLGFNSANDVTLTVMNSATPLNHIANEAAALHQMGVDHINVAGAQAVNVNITDLQAAQLVDGGLSFTTDDHVNVELSAAAGTHVSASLQELQKLGVDSISIAGGGHGAISVDLGDSSQINFDALPQFNTADHVTLSLSGVNDGDAFFAHLDDLHNAGIDTIFVNDSNVELSLAEGEAVASSGLQFSSINDVTLEIDNNVDMASLPPDSVDLQLMGVDHIAPMAALEINESAARVLVHAGIDFTNDHAVTMNVHADADGVGTHLSSTLKDLQKLGVDSVIATGASDLIVDLGAGAFDTLHSLPTFNSALNVTLNAGVGQIGQVASNYNNIHNHGIDSIQIHGSVADLATITQTKVTNAHIDGLTVDTTDQNFATDLAAAVTMPHFGAVHVDKIDIAGAAGHAADFHVSSAAASSMIAAGMSFEAADHISLDVTAGATGTHFATSSSVLHTLGVDDVTVHVTDAPVIDLHALAHFDSALDVTLDLSEVANGHMPNLDAAAGVLLQSLGFDAIEMNADVNSLASQLLGDPASSSDGLLDKIHNVMHMDASIDLHGTAGPAPAANLDAAMQSLYTGLGHNGSIQTDNFDDLLSALSDSGITELTVEQGSVQVSDSLISALAESGMLHAVAQSNIVVDATASGNHMFTSLKDLADLDVDHVNAAASGNLYINLGDLGQVGALNEVKAILAHLDPDMFSGAATPTLVLDTRAAEALSTNGVFDSTVMAGLEQVGIKQVAVLVGHNETTGIVAQTLTPTSPEVKLIGQDADPTLYDDLHHPRH